MASRLAPTRPMPYFLWRLAWGRRARRPKRRGYVRPSRAEAKAGWSLREVAQLTGIATRTLHLYLQRDVLPRPTFKGPATRYQRRQLLWLCAIRYLRATEKLTLAAIRTRLRALSAPELEAFATRHVLPGKLAQALGVPAPPSAGLPTPPLAGAADPSSSQLARWKRIELALGLELHVREDASGEVQELSRRVRELCAGGVTEASSAR